MRSLPVITLVLFGCADQAPPPAAPAKMGLDLSAVPPPPSGHIKGTLELAPAVQTSVKAGDTIFLMARNAGTGAVVAVAKLSASGSFPMPFELTGQNVMMPGGALAGRLQLSARVDKDGNATTKAAGDVVGEVKDLVEVPRQDVVLVLDKVL